MLLTLSLSLVGPPYYIFIHNNLAPRCKKLFPITIHWVYLFKERKTVECV